MGELKSAWEIALEKAKKLEGDEGISLTPQQKEEIAEIRRIYSAKIAEVEILVQEPEKKEIELDRLRRERERKIEAIYEAARKKKNS
jgi:ribosomal protein L23